MGGAVPKRWRSVWCMLCVIHVSARLCRRAACLCRTHMAIARLRSTYVTVCMPVHLSRSTAQDGASGLPWPPEGGEAAHTHTALDWPNTRGSYPRGRLAVRSSTPGVASHSGMHGVESACYMWSHSRPSISRRRVPGPRAASASVAVSTHSRGPPYPRAARTLFLTHLLACHVIPFARRFPCRLRSNDPSAWRGVGLLGHEQIRFP